jgi:hypothetical protein
MAVPRGHLSASIMNGGDPHSYRGQGRPPIKNGHRGERAGGNGADIAPAWPAQIRADSKCRKGAFGQSRCDVSVGLPRENAANHSEAQHPLSAWEIGSLNVADSCLNTRRRCLLIMNPSGAERVPQIATRAKLQAHARRSRAGGKGGAGLLIRSDQERSGQLPPQRLRRRAEFSGTTRQATLDRGAPAAHDC